MRRAGRNPCGAFAGTDTRECGFHPVRGALSRLSGRIPRVGEETPLRIFDIVSSVTVALFGLFLILVIIPGWVPVEAGPGFGLSATTMPIVAAVTVVALAAMFFVYRVRRTADESEENAAYDATAPIERRNWLFLLRGAVFLTAMAALFEFFGFLVAGPPTVAGFMLMMGEKRPIPVALTAICATAAIWLFFWQLLKFELP